MFKKQLIFRIPPHYCLNMTCHAHGWKNLAPFKWSDESKSLSFAAIIGENPVDIEVIQSGGSLKTTLRSHRKLDSKSLGEVRQVTTRSLDLDTETDNLLKVAEKFGEDYVKLIENGAGRMLRAPSLWEDAAKTLFTTNCSWSLTKKMCESACSGRFSKPAPSGLCPFPSSETLSKYSAQDIRKLIPVGYRANYLIELAERFSDDPLLGDIETNGYNYTEANKYVIRSKGFGDYACAHLLVLAGYFDKIPVDTVVVSFLKKNYQVRKPESFIKRKYGKWGEYMWWGFKLDKMLKRQNWLGD
jgi:3-methyladenine DNA glycosylase/8-oxoguanine DNA glycosylase